MTIQFHDISAARPGLLAELLLASYADLLVDNSGYWKGLAKSLADFDREAFSHVHTVGKCVFLTTKEDTIIGFASFDPRQGPEYGIVGHNCIVPSCRRQGIGRRQIEEVLSKFTRMGMSKAIVSTNEHPFFLAARRTYESCGFVESRQFEGGPDPRYAMIEYARDLAPSISHSVP